MDRNGTRHLTLCHGCVPVLFLELSSSVHPISAIPVISKRRSAVHMACATINVMEAQSSSRPEHAILSLPLSFNSEHFSDLLGFRGRFSQFRLDRPSLWNHFCSSGLLSSLYSPNICPNIPPCSALCRPYESCRRKQCQIDWKKWNIVQ